MKNCSGTVFGGLVVSAMVAMVILRGDDNNAVVAMVMIKRTVMVLVVVATRTIAIIIIATLYRVKLVWYLMMSKFVVVDSLVL